MPRTSSHGAGGRADPSPNRNRLHIICAAAPHHMPACLRFTRDSSQILMLAAVCWPGMPSAKLSPPAGRGHQSVPSSSVPSSKRDLAPSRKAGVMSLAAVSPRAEITATPDPEQCPISLQKLTVTDSLDFCTEPLGWSKRRPGPGVLATLLPDLRHHRRPCFARFQQDGQASGQHAAVVAERRVLAVRSGGQGLGDKEICPCVY